MHDTQLHHNIEKAVADIQPLLGLHGGSIELVDISPDNVVSLRFLGACVGCVAADMTLEHGLKEMLMLQFEEINDVIAVNDEPATHEPPAVPLSYTNA